MADEPTPQPEPFEHRSLDTVLSELGKPEATPEPAPKPDVAAPALEVKPDAAAAPKPGEVKPAEPAKPAEAAPTEPFKVGEEAKFKISDTAVKTREEIEKLPYANDATFKGIMGEFEELSQFKVGMSEALNGGAYKIKDADTMKAVLADAFSLYDIANLKEAPSILLDLMEKNYGKENIDQVIAQVLIYAKEKGITAEAYSDLSKPENKRLFDLAKDSRERKAREAEGQTAEQQRAAVKQKEDDFNTLEKHVNKWAEDNKVDKTDALDYLTHVVAQIGGDPKQLAALRAGKFGEVERILTEYNNRMVERQNRWEKAQITAKEAREQKLKGAEAPAGGAGVPREQPKKKVDINDEDSRMDAIKEALRS